jgi:monoamine oxidase
MTTRRQFIKGALASAAASLIKASPLTIKAPPKKVLILGAGMAGLVAAYELTQLGHDVTILEARTRPGGRCHTIREPFSDGLFAEAGAARIPDGHDLTLKYAKQLEVPLEPMYPSRGSSLAFNRGGRREGGIELFTEALGQGFGGDLGGNPTHWQKIKGGTDMLPKAFAQRLATKIRYNSPVVKIEQDEKSASAVFLHGGAPETMSADRLLCTIPFSVLRGVELPGLSDRRLDLIKRIRYAAVSRVYLQSRNRFWEAKGLNGFAFTDDDVEIWQPTWSQPGPRGILMTYARPGVAERITSMKESERVSTTLAKLDEIFPGLRTNFETGASKCWLDDEWSRGAWGFAGLRDFENTNGTGGRIHFAGEHLSTWSSWIQGALQSGLRAVKEIDEAV